MEKAIRALSVGAILWDVIGKKEYIGGAPFNVAANLKKLGAESMFVTRVGLDERGDRAVAEIRRQGIRTDLIQRDSVCATGVALATLDEAGNATYQIPHAAFDEICITEETLAIMNGFCPDVVCFGSFEQRSEKSRRAIHTILENVPAKTVFFDVNIRMGFCDKSVFDFCLRRTNVLKLNEDECRFLSGLFFGKEMDPPEFSRCIAEEYGVGIVLVTLGAKGCFVYDVNGAEQMLSAESVHCADTIGAGDAFSSAFLRSYLAGNDPVTAAKCGNLLGAYVAGRSGALPQFDDNIIESLTQMSEKGGCHVSEDV